MRFVSNGATRGKKHLGGQSGILDKMYSSCINYLYGCKLTGNC